MKYFCTRALTSLLLPTLCYTQFMCAAAPNPFDPVEKSIKAAKKEARYHKHIAHKLPFSSKYRYPLHTLIIQAATDDEFKKLEAILLDPKISLCEADIIKGNTPFHLLAQCDLQHTDVSIPNMETIINNLLSDVEAGTLSDLETTQLINEAIAQLEENLKITRSDLEMTQLAEKQLKNRYQRKPEVITALCAALEQRALQKAIAVDPALGHPITGADGCISFAPPYAWKEFANGTHMLRPTVTPNPLGLHIIDLPDDMHDLLVDHLNYSDFMALRAACKTIYFATLRRAARTTQKKYVLDTLSIRNRAEKTALEEVQESRTKDAIDAHNKKLTDLQYVPGLGPITAEEEIKSMFQQAHNAQEEQFPIQQYVAAQLEQLEAKYMRMPGNITCNPKPAPTTVARKAANAVLSLPNITRTAFTNLLFSKKKNNPK
jgi:hypothetical protein